MPADLASSIDGLLKKRGSPMAGLGSTFVAAGQKYGVDPRLVVSISGIESGFGKHLYGDFNAWGWGPGRAFGSWEEGIRAVTEGLRTGYYDRGLRTPDQIVQRYAPSSDGNDTENWAKVVSGFMNQLGGPIGTGAQTKSRTVPAIGTKPPPSTSGIRQAALTNLATVASRGGRVDPIGMMLSLASGSALDQQIDRDNALNATPKQGGGKENPPPPSADVDVDFTPGIPVVGGSAGGEHGTSGLPGYSGIDYFAPAGSPALAPISGKVSRLSGYDPKLGAVQGAGGPLGWSVYIEGDDGRTYFLTHMGSRTVRPGQRVNAGQRIGTVANYDKYGRQSHIHMGIKG